MNELVYKYWFYSLPINNFKKISILEKKITPYELWNYRKIDYINIDLNIIEAEEIEKSKNLDSSIKNCEYLLKEKIKFILYNEYDYPAPLKDIYNPPAGLFIKGQMPDNKNSIAIVGARKASDYGKAVAYKIAYELAGRGIAIISGMARGIDSCGHRGAMDGRGLTVGVMGSGLKNIYPKENKLLAEEISKNGCVITEYVPDEMPMPYNFPERNRIISGLAKYVLVVEAGERSGSLITANLALEQGKDVFAVPGNIFSFNSTGTNKLIKDGAKPITCTDDVLEEFNLFQNKNRINTTDEMEITILNLLKSGGMNIEHILQSSNLDSNFVLTTLSRLECKGIIKRVYGNYYILS